MDHVFPPGFFISATGSGTGKTFLARGIAGAFASQGYRTVALKPVETGWSEAQSDAASLARACGTPQLANTEGLYRERSRLSPYALALDRDVPPPDINSVHARVGALVARADVAIVEGNGALLTPLDARTTVADLVDVLKLPLLLVAPDRLDSAPQAMASYDATVLRALEVAAVVLTQVSPRGTDRSQAYNTYILQEHLPVPVVSFPYCQDNDEALALAAADCGLLDLLKLR